MTILLNLRFIQIKRAIKDLGIRSLLIPPAVCLLVFKAFLSYQKTPDAYILSGLLLLICYAVQVNRADKVFVSNHIYQPNLEIFSEYFLLTFPFAVPCLFTSNWFCYPILLTAIYLITFIKTERKDVTHFRNITNVIPAKDFEIISGYRKTFLYLLPIYLLAVCFCWFTILPLFLLWLITLTIVSFYDECEPLVILRAHHLKPNNFLNQKLVQHSKYLLLLHAPLLIINTIVNFDYLIINLFFLPIQLSLLCFAICFKYTLYQPNISLKANSIVLSMVSLFSIIPFLLPIPLLMAIYYYRKAINNLYNYLND